MDVCIMIAVYVVKISSWFNFKAAATQRVNAVLKVDSKQALDG